MVGPDPACVETFKSHFYGCNVWVPRSGSVPEGHTVLSGELFPERQLPETEFYADWLRPWNLHHAIGCTVLKDASRHVKLSFVRSRQAGAFGEPERRTLSSLLPHVRNAFLLHKHVGHLRSLADSACAALDRIPIGCVLLARNGDIVHANAAARGCVERTRALSLANPLSGGTPSQAAALRQLIFDAASTSAGAAIRSGGALKLLGLTGEMQVFVTPLQGAGSPLPDMAAVALFCTDPHEEERDLVGVLRALHQLTPAEAALATSLLHGESLSDVCERRDVSVNTVRTHLKSICQKTGTRRQADVVRVLLRSLAAFPMDAAG
jgi:DNA-binding CsgD family transcriptional regulator